MDTNMSEKTEVTLDEEPIVLYIPKSTLELTIEAKIWRDGAVNTVRKIMSFEETRAAVEDAKDNYIPEDAIFTLTEKGKEELERLRREQLDGFREE